VIPSLSAAFQVAWQHDGLLYLLFGVVLAGLVRGFSGFGTALIYMPIAGTVLPPVWAVITMLVFDVPGTTPLIRRTLKDCHKRDVGRLLLGALIALPFGLFLLSRFDPELFRWLVSLISFVLLALLIAGWRYHGVLSRKITTAVGAICGFLAGISGLPGPPVIMLYMSSRHPVQVIRANILLFLFLVDILTLAMMAVSGMLVPTPVLIGLILALPYALANIAGASLFRADREKLFRAVAYILIAGSAVTNLPLLR